MQNLTSRSPMSRITSKTNFALPALFLLLAATAQGQNSTEAGQFTVEHPTLHNLGFEWAIGGDASYNMCGHSHNIPSRRKVDFLTFCRLGWRGVHLGRSI